MTLRLEDLMRQRLHDSSNPINPINPMNAMNAINSINSKNVMHGIPVELRT
jgi:hypothetical protein